MQLERRNFSLTKFHTNLLNKIFKLQIKLRSNAILNISTLSESLLYFV